MSVSYGKGRAGMKRKGKGRRVKTGVMARGTMIRGKFQENNGLEAASYGGWRYKSERAETRAENRRGRRKARKFAIVLVNEIKMEKEEEELLKKKQEKEYRRKKEALKKKQAEELYELRQNFFRDFFEMKNRHEREMMGI